MWWIARITSLLTLCCLSVFPLKAEIGDPLRNRINLALRQVGHHLLLAQQDSTSQIAPVQYDGQSGFLLPIRRPFTYDLLPDLLEQAFTDYHITAPYELLVISCHQGTPLLGYNKYAVSQESVPCLGREQPIGCTNIFVQFEKEEDYFRVPKSALAWLVFPVLLGLGLLVVKRKGMLSKNETGPIHSSDAIPLGQFLYEPQNQRLVKGEVYTELTFRENKLLNLLASQPNIVLERAHILSVVWEDEGVVVGRSLDVFISRLRKLLKADPTVQIKTIHGVGYRLEVPS